MALEVKETKYGKVFRLVGGCRDDWKNIVTMTVGGQYAIGGPETYTLQEPAILSLKAVAKACGALGPFRFRSRPVHVTGSLRTCARQAELYASDPNRYAPPSVGLHTQGLAIDVDTIWQGKLSDKQNAAFRKAMLANGWTQSRPSDEPWHWSYGWTA